MGTYVKDGNSCIGCESANSFPDECGGCNNLKSQIELIKLGSKLKTENDRMRNRMRNRMRKRWRQR